MNIVYVVPKPHKGTDVDELEWPWTP